MYSILPFAIWQYPWWLQSNPSNTDVDTGETLQASSAEQSMHQAHTTTHFSAQDLQSDVEHGAPLGQTEVSLMLRKESETACDIDGK